MIRRLALAVAGCALLVPTIGHAQNSAGYGTYADAPAAQTPAVNGMPSEGGLLGYPEGAFSGGLKLGTLGVGPELGWRPLPMFGLRADAGFFSFDDTFHAGRVTYNATAHLESYGLLGDLYPFGQSFRVTAGMRLNENDVRGQSQSVDVTTRGITVTVPTSTLGAIGGKVTFDKLSPYLGIGWGGEIAPGLSITSDIGVMFNGNPKASVTASGPAAALAYGSGGVATARSDLQGYVNGYAYYPVLELGLVYKF